jgi:hypothetical protein
MKTKINTLILCLLFFKVNATDDYNIYFDTVPKENVLTSETVNGDTLTKHKVFQIDDHLIISDTVIIKTPEIKVKTVVKDKTGLRSILIPVFALLFAVIAIILKRKNNG